MTWRPLGPLEEGPISVTVTEHLSSRKRGGSCNQKVEGIEKIGKQKLLRGGGTLGSMREVGELLRRIWGYAG